MNTEERNWRIRIARTFLFVPGDKPDRIAKALQSKADAVIIDLEDAVRSENKSVARTALGLPLRVTDGPLIFIRVNAFGSHEFNQDVRKALELEVDGIVLPKFVPGDNAIATDQALTQLEVESGSKRVLPTIGLIESSAGVLGLLNSSSIPTRVQRLAFGGADLYTDLRIAYSPAGPNTDLAMAALVMASVHSRLGAPIDTPHFTLTDTEGLRDRSLYASQMGFGGKLCIHPNQLEVVDQSFAPSEDESEWAKRVIERWDERDESSGALVVDANLVDTAMLKRARQILGLI
ncbi:MAG TPA: CoA ester lyase [Candidatus Paceibacterota bacterium]|nr:CoA ester lyase [Candidatus Paceibacterota bacterium]